MYIIIYRLKRWLVRWLGGRTRVPTLGGIQVDVTTASRGLHPILASAFRLTDTNTEKVNLVWALGVYLELEFTVQTKVASWR